jgi:Fe-S-cluster containining protein
MGFLKNEVHNLFEITLKEAPASFIFLLLIWNSVCPFLEKEATYCRIQGRDMSP